ncbi:2,3-diketo-5-methylthiopentyl-1-phosphate enolase [bacterium]|nr:2,3-diketo-5-methylthiopentyl-1-phosphate enolase [bacterium]
MANETIEVDYRFPPGVDAATQARIIATGQTAGTWDARHTHRESALLSHLAEVTGVERRDDGSSVATVAFPAANVEGDIASLLTMIFGKYSMAGPAKVVGLRLPNGYGTPNKYGTRGLRRLLDVPERPLLMAIFKPALGLVPTDYASIYREIAGAGLDIVKDDEIVGDLPDAPVFARLAAIREAAWDNESRSGRATMYAVNLTGPADRLRERALGLIDAGATALLFNVLAYGFAALESLAADEFINVPIFAHPALAGAWCGAPDHGFSYDVLLGTLFAHAGADAALYPASYGNLPIDAETESRLVAGLRKRGTAPVPSAGITPGIVPRALADHGNDIILNAGTGIMDHPDGAAAGVAAFFEAIERALRGDPVTRDAVPEGALARALEKWGMT